ncbi:MAG: hypothetical protein JKY96_03700, partial [Phycisphaerales bacterium]|nr:hypothetical protein [Phycisphaerales bacterium]
MPVAIKRYLVWGIICVVAGFAISFATAYLGVWYVIPREYDNGVWKSAPNVEHYYGEGPADNRWTLDLERLSFGVFMGSLLWVGQYSINEDGWDQRRGPESVPHWSRANRPPDPARDDFGLIYEVTAGFPIASWRGEYRKYGFLGAGERWACIELQSVRGHRYPVLVPTMPIFPEGVLNAFIWGGLLFVVTVEPKRIYRFGLGCIRRRKGQCPNCGYPIEGLATCPECGNVVRKENAEPV